MIYTIENEFLKVEVNDMGAELWNIFDKKNQNNPRLWQGDPEVWNERSPVLFPYCGALKEGKFIEEGVTYPGAPHGFGKTLVHDVESETNTSIIFRLVADEKLKELYPWDFVLETEYRLEENRLVCIFHVANAGSSRMPFGVGFHTGYRCPFSSDYTFDDYRVKFEKKESPIHLKHNENGNLTGEEAEFLHDTDVLSLKNEEFPNSFILTNIISDYVELEEVPTGRYIRLYPDGAPLMAFWSQPARAEYVCIQPWYNSPDSCNSDNRLWSKRNIQVLNAGEAADFKQTIEVGVHE